MFVDCTAYERNLINICQIVGGQIKVFSNESQWILIGDLHHILVAIPFVVLIFPLVKNHGVPVLILDKSIVSGIKDVPLCAIRGLTLKVIIFVNALIEYQLRVIEKPSHYKFIEILSCVITDSIWMINLRDFIYLLDLLYLLSPEQMCIVILKADMLLIIKYLRVLNISKLLLDDAL